MASEDLPAAHEDLYVELMQGSERTGSFIVETKEDRPDMVFEVEPADKPTRNQLQRLLPSDLFSAIDIPDDVEDVEDISVDDIDLSGVSINDMAFSKEATNTWLDTIADHYSHDYYSRSEIRNIFDRLPDDYFITAGSYLIELGNSTGPVTGFRRED